MDLDIVFLDHKPGPHLFHELILRHHIAFGGGKYAQYVKRARAKPDWRRLKRQFALAHIEAERPETDLISIHDTAMF
jgi:hypothetical protein